MRERTLAPLRVTHAMIPVATYALLEAAAKRRGQHVDRLTAALVTIIAEDDLFDALLLR